MMNSIDIKQKDKEYVAATYARFDLALTHGEGSYLYDAEGKRYIDMSSGIAVNTLGTADPGWVRAVTEQLSRLSHTSNLYYSEPGALLAEQLCTRTGARSVFFSNSGAEANECAIKCARLWAAKNKGSEYFGIITLKNSFHGRTVTTLAATGQEVFHTDFTPLTEGFYYAEAGNLASVEELLKGKKCAAVMMEPVQGEGGVVPLSREFVLGVFELAEKYNVLVIFDEVQTGNGRSGYLYAYEAFGKAPDILSTAKGLGGGLPIGATLFFEKTHGTLGAGQHGSTFGANPVAAAGALHVLSRLDGEFLASVREKSEYIISALSDAAGIVSVSGMGLMLGIETVADAGAVISECMRRGVLVIKAKTKVRLLPPLNIPTEALREAVEVIKSVAAELANK
ncbi:MAG: acetylornithine transaminase [Clostridia bacterium]|nr:acetylornithine transaminase [Clostridia bacterium]